MFLLFSAAARTDLSVLWHIRDLPARLLAIGLPLTIAAGALAAWLVLPSLTSLATTTTCRRSPNRSGVRQRRSLWR